MILEQRHANLLRYLGKTKGPFVLRALLPWHVEAEAIGMIRIEPGPTGGFGIVATPAGLDALAAHPPYRTRVSRTP